MANAVRETITVFRKDPMCLPFIVEGADLSSVTCTLSIGLYPDVASKLMKIGMSGVVGGPGIRFIQTWTDADGIKWSKIEIIASKSMMATLPAAIEAGADLRLFYDFQWTLPASDDGFSSVEETALYGDIIVKGSIND